MRCVIFGAGKIARGFIGHLLYLSDIPFTFVEKYEPLADLINELATRAAASIRARIQRKKG